MKNEFGHIAIIEEKNSEGYKLYCTCGWYGGIHQNYDDAICDHEDHAAGHYER